MARTGFWCVWVSVSFAFDPAFVAQDDDDEDDESGEEQGDDVDDGSRRQHVTDAVTHCR